MKVSWREEGGLAFVMIHVVGWQPTSRTHKEGVLIVQAERKFLVNVGLASLGEEVLRSSSVTDVHNHGDAGAEHGTEDR